MSASDVAEPVAQRAERLRSLLDDLCDRLSAPGGHLSASLAATEELLTLVGGFEDEAALALVDDGARARYRRVFGPAVLRFTWAMEQQTHATVLARRAHATGDLGATLGQNAWGAYRGMGQALALADASRCESFAMVGCGPVPDSLFHLHDHTEIPRLVGFDNDGRALAMARELVDALGLRRIELEAADACDVDYARFDAVCCSAFLTRRKEVMRRIAATARTGALVFLRDPVLAGTLLFESVAGALPDRLRVRARSAGAPGRFKLRYFALDVLER